jgi:DNA polymerase-3 subunit epsilon
VPIARELAELASTMRGALGSLRAAAETLEKFPALEGVPRARLLAVVADETERLGTLVYRLEELAQSPSARATGEPSEARLSVVELATRLATAAVDLGFELSGGPLDGEDEAAAVVDVPGPLMVRAAADFLAVLRREMAVARLDLGVRIEDRHVLLDLGWSADPATLPRLLDWQVEALDRAAGLGGERTERQGLRPLARDHDGEAWFILDRDGSGAHVRVLLPLVALAEPVLR